MPSLKLPALLLALTWLVAACGAVCTALEIEAVDRPTVWRVFEINTPIALDGETRRGEPSTKSELALSLERIEFKPHEGRLTAAITASVTTPRRDEFAFHVALVDADGRLLGTASHHCGPSDMCISVPMRIQGTYELDFGQGVPHEKARRFSVAIVRGTVIDGGPTKAQYTLALQGQMQWVNQPKAQSVGTTRVSKADDACGTQSSNLDLPAPAGADAALPVTLGRQIALPRTTSAPAGATALPIRPTAIKFEVDGAAHFVARLSTVAAVPRRAETAVHVAILDAQRRLLGVCRRPCDVPSEWTGSPRDIGYDLTLDFGRHDDYRSARWFVATLTEESPPQGE